MKHTKNKNIVNKQFLYITLLVKQPYVGCLNIEQHTPPIVSLVNVI